MEVHDIEQEEIRPLIFNYLFHFFLFILIFVLHLIIYSKVYWISEIFEKFFITLSFLIIIYFLFPIIPLTMIFLKRFKLKLIHIFKKLSFLFLILSILIGILISVVIFINTLNSKLFCQECPFSWSITLLNQVFQKYYGKPTSQNNIKDECKSRRCILDSVDSNEKHPYTYLCNYDASYDFDDDGSITCLSVGLNYRAISFQYNELYDYLDLCYYLAEFYYCKRANKPEKMYVLDVGDSCPENNYLFLLYILCVLLIIIDIVISLLPWGVEYVSLKRIIQMMLTGVRKANSNNSTARSSKISNEVSFKKENTIILVSPINNDETNSRNNKKLILKDSTNQMLNNSKDEEIKDEIVIKPIKIIQDSERNELKKELENKNNMNINSINVYNKNEASGSIHLSTEINAASNTANPNLKDKIEEEKNK